MSEGDRRVAAALARNDRYVREFVEALNLCPYAKRTRETGKLKREVLLDAGGAPDTPGFAAAVASLDAAFQRFEYDFVATILLAIIALIFAGEILSGWLRRMFQ